MKNFILTQDHVIATNTGVIYNIKGNSKKAGKVNKFVCTDKDNQLETIKDWAVKTFGTKSNLTFHATYHCYSNDITII